MRRDMLGEPVYSAGVESLEKPAHPTVVGRWIVNFIASGEADASAAKR